MSYRGVAPSFVYKIDHRFPKTGDFKSSGRKYTLESEITKLIVYSNCETKLNTVLWRMSYEEEIIKTTETWEIKPEMNVICLCRYRMTEEWADEYRLKCIVTQTSCHCKRHQICTGDGRCSG